MGVSKIKYGVPRILAEMRKNYEDNIKKDVMIFYDEELNDIENEQQEIRNIEKSKNEIIDQIQHKLEEIKQFISHIS